MRKINDKGYSMVGLVFGAAIMLILAIGGFIGYGYLPNDGNDTTNKTVNEILDEADTAKDVNDSREEKIINELENNSWYCLCIEKPLQIRSL